MTDPPLDGLRRRDEILQVMYWLWGEGLGDAAGAGELRVFLDDDAADRLESELAALARMGLLEPAGDGRFRLTAAGREEGGRRFAEAFAGLTQQGHGACSDPACECHMLGPEACTRTLDPHAH